MIYKSRWCGGDKDMFQVHIKLLLAFMVLINFNSVKRFGKNNKQTFLLNMDIWLKAFYLCF